MNITKCLSKCTATFLCALVAFFGAITSPTAAEVYLAASLDSPPPECPGSDICTLPVHLGTAWFRLDANCLAFFVSLSPVQWQMVIRKPSGQEITIRYETASEGEPSAIFELSESETGELLAGLWYLEARFLGPYDPFYSSFFGGGILPVDSDGDGIPDYREAPEPPEAPKMHFNADLTYSIPQCDTQTVVILPCPVPPCQIILPPCPIVSVKWSSALFVLSGNLLTYYLSISGGPWEILIRKPSGDELLICPTYGYGCQPVGILELSESDIMEVFAGLWYVEARYLGSPLFNLPSHIFGGHILSLDSDFDGVPDSRDACGNTRPGTVANGEGCSIEQLSPCEGPWKNHGEYVRRVVSLTAAFLNSGLITPAAAQAILERAAQSDCGHRRTRCEGRTL